MSACSFQPLHEVLGMGLMLLNSVSPVLSSDFSSALFADGIRVVESAPLTVL